MLGVFFITRAGLLVAASVILTRWFGAMVPLAGVGALRLSFGDIPIILAGLVLGPLGGSMVGVAADLLGFALNPMGGAYFPGFTLTAALTGVLPALFYKAIKAWRTKVAAKAKTTTTSPTTKPTYTSLLNAIAASDLITSVILNTYWIHLMYGKAIAVILPARVAARVVLVPFFALVVRAALAALAANSPATRNAPASPAASASAEPRGTDD